jgi:hypothetical protein
MPHRFITGGNHFTFDLELLKCRPLVFLNKNDISCTNTYPHSAPNFKSGTALVSGVINYYNVVRYSLFTSQKEYSWEDLRLLISPSFSCGTKHKLISCSVVHCYLSG